ncbi:SIR2 family protein [Priestia megaterium]|uniref:SIR2 family NAD-dependent protein deacylase n=2 Tax=Priestia megaterium TaxID=1404 RepID=UPI000BF6572C|nr:SIR2 family protein [Priestia megaterium]PFP10144.1 SIR2 family protein [Priestia megaterium]
MDINLEKVINKIRRNSVTLWAGAGLSLYAGLPTGRKLADEIVKQMPKVYQDEFKGKALPEVAEEFVQMHSNSPLEAFSILNTYLNKEPQSIIYHEKLSEIPQIKNIVTTNYDDLFERAYGKSKLSVILENSHIPLANTPVKLYKIHGDMSHPESIVLTTSDYNDFFSFSHKNDSIWNKVTSLADETSFLFLGYSLEDPNVKTLMNELIRRVGKFRHESFLVVPDLQEYKVQNLHEKGITYINMTGEEFIEKIHSEILLKIVEDHEAGFLKTEEVDELLNKRNINAKFEFKKGKSSLIEFGIENDDEPLNLKFDIRREEHETFIDFLTNDIENQEIEIDGDAISNIVSEHKGILFPPFDSPGDMVNVRVIKYPDRVLEGNFVIRETDDILEDIKVHIFKNQNATRIKFMHDSFTLQTIDKVVDGNSIQSLNVSFERSGNLAKDYKASILLHNWLINGHTINFNNFTDKNVFPLQSPKELMTQSEKAIKLGKEITFFADLYKKIFKVQNHFGVYFTVPEKLTKQDEEALNKALVVANKHKYKIGCLETLIGTESNQETIQNLLESESLPFKNVFEKTSEVTVFGQKINLGYCFVETIDAYLVNKEDVSKQIQEKANTIYLIIKSKSDEMYMGYQEKKEI